MKSVVGIDEVGRGPVAGPVAVAAFWLRGKITNPKINGRVVPLRDSKKLTREQREAWYSEIVKMENADLCDFAVTMVSAKKVDSIGIAVALRLALARSLQDIKATPEIQILLDGGLKAPLEFKKQKTIIKGDEKEKAIALASIVAKVNRDRYMFKQDKKFPDYGFGRHVGYGTRAHYEAIQKHGMCELHRRSFLRRLSEK